MAAQADWTTGKRHVLVVDDDRVDRQMVVRYLSETFLVTEATCGREALATVSDRLPDCILLDFDLGRENAIHLMPGFVERGLAVVVYSGRGNETIAAMTYRLGGSDYLIKDRLNQEVLTRAIDKAICRSSVRRIVDQSLAFRRSQISMPSAEQLDDPLDTMIVGEFGIHGQQIEMARKLFREIVDDVVGGITEQGGDQVFSKSRILAVGLGELRVASSEVLNLLKRALTHGSQRADKTESQLYAESCQAAALEVMAHLADYYRQRQIEETRSGIRLN